MANSAVASDLFSLDYEAKKLGCFTAHKFTVLELVETKIEKKKNRRRTGLWTQLRFNANANAQR